MHPEGTTSGWLEPSDRQYFTIIALRDVYKHPQRGRTLEFVTEDQAVRNVAIKNIVLHAETAHRLNQLRP